MPPDVPSMLPDADRVLISVSPMAERGSTQRRVEQLANLLQQQGFRTEIRTELGEVEELAAKWHADGDLRALVGVGGDGTAAELVNRTMPGVPLSLLPSGNENLLARHLGLGQTPESVARAVGEGTLARLDSGRANGRLFLLMVGCGFDADVVRRVHARRKGRVRSRDYFKPILQSIRSYEYPELRIYWGDDSEPLTARWLFVFNLPCYGGGLRLAPEADGTDGWLDVCAFRRGSLCSGLRYAAAIGLGRHQTMADCTVRRAQRLRITSDAEAPYQLDGDPGGVLPLDIEVIPDRLTVVVPAREAE